MGWNGFHCFQKHCIGILGWDVQLGHPGRIQEISSLVHMRSCKWHLASPFLRSPKICLWIKYIFNPFLPQYFSHTHGSRSHRWRQNRPDKKWERTGQRRNRRKEDHKRSLKKSSQRGKGNISDVEEERSFRNREVVKCQTSLRSQEREVCRKLLSFLVLWIEEKPDGSTRDPAAFFSESWQWRKEGAWHLLANWHPHFPYIDWKNIWNLYLIN